MKVKVKCGHCGCEVEKESGHINRANKLGLKLFCNKACFGLYHRTTKEQKVALKRQYDIKYRKKNSERITERTKAYEKTPAGRAMQKRNREKFKQSHLEYCRTEEYKKWKHEYDQKHVAKKMYGELWESHLVLKEVEKIIEPEKLECKVQKGTYNKSQKRKRLWNSMQKT